MPADSPKTAQANARGARRENANAANKETATMIQVGFRVTPKELKIIDRKAFDKGMTRADYLRQKYRDGESNGDLQAAVEGLRDQLDTLQESMEGMETKLSREIVTSDTDLVFKVVDEIYNRLETAGKER